MKKFVSESLNEYGPIPWSGKDPTKARVIGTIITKEMDLGDYHLTSVTMEVVEIIGDIYICNTWYKPGVPQVIHDDMVKEFIPK
jgi:hypothetical protein